MEKDVFEGLSETGVDRVSVPSSPVGPYERCNKQRRLGSVSLEFPVRSRPVILVLRDVPTYFTKQDCGLKDFGPTVKGLYLPLRLHLRAPTFCPGNDN